MEIPHPPLYTMKRNKLGWTAFAFLLAFSCVNLFEALWIIPKFQQIYVDMGVNLTPVTLLVLHWRFLLALLALVWPTMWFLVVRRNSVGILLRFALPLIAVASVIQTGFTTIILFVPLIVTIQGVQPAK
jgi:hypothetical protein